MSKNQLSDVIAGKKDPTLGWLKRLVVPLQVQVHELVGPPPPSSAELESNHCSHFKSPSCAGGDGNDEDVSVMQDD